MIRIMTWDSVSEYDDTTPIVEVLVILDGSIIAGAAGYTLAHAVQNVRKLIRSMRKGRN